MQRKSDIYLNYWIYKSRAVNLAFRKFEFNKIYCQAQFKFSTSSVQFELRLALSLIITPPSPTLPHPPGKVEMQL